MDNPAKGWLEVEGDKWLSVSGLTGGVKAALEVSVGKGL